MEYWIWHPGYSLTDSAASRIRDTASRLELELSVCALGDLKGNEGREELEPLFRFARALNCRTVTVAASPAQLPHLEALADAFSLRVAVENRYRRAAPWGEAFEDIGHAARLLERHKSCLGLNLDTGHCLAAGIDPVDAIGRVAHRLYHVHLKDIAPTPLHEGLPPTVEPGTGKLTVSLFLWALNRIGYRGQVSIEYDGTGEVSSILKRTYQRYCSLVAPGDERHQTWQAEGRALK